MILAALVLQAGVVDGAVEAERAFARQAAEQGQWTAFRAFAAEGATMFVPAPVDAHAYLAPLADPPRAIRWSPAASYVSCDGATAANTGPWTDPAGGHGFFSTVWRKQAEGWRWAVDGGGALASPRPALAEPRVERASCAKAPFISPPPIAAGWTGGGGASRDRSLVWLWRVAPDLSRTFTVRLWDGNRYRLVIDDTIAAPTT